MHEVRIDGLGTAGDGVARLDTGEVVFVDGAFPGDLVDPDVTRFPELVGKLFVDVGDDRVV